MPTAAVVVSWEGGETTARSVASLRAQDRPPAAILVVDNASGERERSRLEAAYAGAPDVRVVLLEENRQFAGGLNAGAAAALAAGADRLLLLNNDTSLAPDALRHLEDALATAPWAGIAGPRVVDARQPERDISLGERHLMPLLCAPRTLLRHRPTSRTPFRGLGVMGCAMLVTRPCFEATGGFTEHIEVYYEDVDFCLAARARGFGVVIVPDAVVRHDGMRGFAAGLTPWAAFLKARNPWLVMRRHAGLGSWLTFVPTYGALVGASAALWAMRGEMATVRALGRGLVAGLRTLGGRAPEPVGPPRPVA